MAMQLNDFVKSHCLVQCLSWRGITAPQKVFPEPDLAELLNAAAAGGDKRDSFDKSAPNCDCVSPAPRGWQCSQHSPVKV